MKSSSTRNLLSAAAAVVAAFLLSSPATAGHGSGKGQSGSPGGSCGAGFNAVFSEIEVGTLSADEIDGVIYMREEQKLARDVYLTFAKKWELPIFENISRAEQRHMDAVGMIFTTYDSAIKDPGFDDTVGVFANSELTTLYRKLVETGSASLTEALMVGASIEDLDLKEIEKQVAAAKNEHLKVVYNNLSKGSRNHLRAFMKALTAKGGEYKPAYLDQATFDSILESDTERGIVYGADGEALAHGGAGRNEKGQKGQCQGRGRGQGKGQGMGQGKGKGHGCCGASGSGGGACKGKQSQCKRQPEEPTN